MARKRSPPAGPDPSLPTERSGRRTTIKDLAIHLGLSRTTVSLVLNRSPLAESIPPETHARVRAAAKQLRYRPNQVAKALRSRRSQTVGVLVPEIDEPYAAGVMSGIEQHLATEGFFYLVASHRSRPELLEEYIELFETRLVEGLILLATRLTTPPAIPTVVVSGHEELEGVTNVILDHDLAVHLALAHLSELGHQRIAVVKGQPGSADTETRWQAIVEAAGRLGISIEPDLVFQLQDDPTGTLTRTEEGYRDGYRFGRELAHRRGAFTAVFAFNDVSAIGVMRGLLEAGLAVPADVSVVGFDDIASAGFHYPGLTTVRQPLREMGQTAGRILFDRISEVAELPPFVTIAPELVVRESTGPARPVAVGVAP